MSPTGFCRTSRILILGSLLALLSGAGCGNNLQTQVQTALPDTYAPADPLQAGFDDGKDPITGDTQSNVTNYACPTTANVTPDYDWQLNGSGYFTVCPARANTTDVLIHGTPTQGNVLCIFPAQAANPSNVVIPRDGTTGAPLFQCVQSTATGTYVTFTSGLAYNAAYIVDLQDVTQMQGCLAQTDYFLCPRNYSFGVFRDYSTSTSTATTSSTQ